jgi:nicotinate dehydrogenase subunit B
MNGKPDLQVPLEPERYELSAPPAYRFEVDRREFFKFLGAGILVVAALKSADAFQESGIGTQSGESLPSDIGAWLHIGENGTVTVYTGKVEVGQNIRTSLSQCVAEELYIPINKIQMVMGDTQLTPFDMGTFGSRSTPTMSPQLRKVAAAARELLIDLAATQWQVDRQRLMVSDGKVADRVTQRSVEYAALVKGQQLTQAISTKEVFIPPTQWTVQGQSLPKVDGREFVTGRHRYPSDQTLPGMAHGKVLRPPAFGATLLSIDAREAEQIPAVAVVRDGNFVGVVAPTSEIAVRAIKAIRAEWKTEPQPSRKEIFEYLKRNAVEDQDAASDSSLDDIGSVKTALAAADHRLQASYTVSYIAHAPLEPRAAVAQWSGDHVTVWTGTQRPFGVRSELAEAFRIPEESVRVIMPDTGSGYGGKHTGEAAVEAARLARSAKRPVKLVWTREEEFTWAYFRPAGVIEINAGLRDDGTIVAWEFHNYNSGEAGIKTYFDISNQKIKFHSTRSPLRQGSYPRAGGDRKSLRSGIVYGRTGSPGEYESAGFSAEESEERAASRSF